MRRFRFFIYSEDELPRSVARRGLPLSPRRLRVLLAAGCLIALAIYLMEVR